MSKTSENLKTAIQGETLAAAKYIAYAAKALQEGYPEIALLFEAVSLAERIHAANHTKALVRMGGEPLDMKLEITVGNTAENLMDAISGETYEVMDMYPAMIDEATQSGDKDALRSFTWAWESEKSHARMFTTALHQLDAQTELQLPHQYWVCPLCGYTVDSLEDITACPVCGMPVSRFRDISLD